MGKYLFVLLGGFFLCVCCCYLLRKLSLRHSLLVPQGIPLVGGMALGWSFVCASFLGIYLFKFISSQLYGVLLASLMILVFGMLDDWREQSIAAKLLAQFFVTLVLIVFGVRTHIVYIGNTLNYILTAIWVVAITNAFNHLDVMDGIAGVVACMISLAFLGLGIMAKDTQVVILSLALTGGCVGFLLFNLPPAKLYLGNAGSHFIGLLLAAIALIIRYAPMDRMTALFSPVLILGLPIFDTALLVIMRLYKKKIPFKKSADHAVLRFLALGYSKKTTILIIGLWNIFFILCGILVSEVPNTYAIATIAVTALVTAMLTRKICSVSING